MSPRFATILSFLRTAVSSTIKSLPSISKQHPTIMPKTERTDSPEIPIIKRSRVEEPPHKFLKEADVGITQYISKNCDGFDAIIKHRFADFFVNEITPAGTVLHLTSFTEVADTPPPPPKPADIEPEIVVPEDPKEAAEEGLKRLDEFLGAEGVASVRGLLDIEDPSALSLHERTFLLDREMTKPERTGVYKVTNNFFPVQLTCETVDGKLKFIRRSVSGDNGGGPSRRNNRGRRNGAEWNHGGDYCYFLVQKENRESMDVLTQIARNLKVKPRLFSMAGTKDKRGITVQRCSAFRVDHNRLIWVSRKLQGARLGNFSYGSDPIKLGDLSGNQFTIVLRHVKCLDEASVNRALESVGTAGFINYYGMQRFGTNSIPSHSIGIAVLKADWHGAIDLVLCPREGDRPDVRRAREIWSETRDPSAALAALPVRSALAEHNILQHFAKNNSTANAAAAFAAVPRNLRLMYVHAYQSYIWNSAASKRCELFGIDKPVPGDLAIKASDFGISSDSADGVGSDSEEDVHSKRPRCEPALVTAENAGEFTIYDVVLPLPGWDVKYPGHEVKDVYTDLMRRDGLDPFKMDAHPLKEYKLAGAYRHLVVRPRAFTYEWMKYNDDKLPLARSDSDAIMGKHVPASLEFGEFTALKLAFDLPSSAYATMLLREIMRRETAAGHQTTLSGQAGCAGAGNNNDGGAEGAAGR